MCKYDIPGGIMRHAFHHEKNTFCVNIFFKENSGCIFIE